MSPVLGRGSSTPPIAKPKEQQSRAGGDDAKRQLRIFNPAEGSNKLALFKYLLLNCLPCVALAKQGSSVQSLAKRGHPDILSSNIPDTTAGAMLCNKNRYGVTNGTKLSIFHSLRG